MKTLIRAALAVATVPLMLSLIVAAQDVQPPQATPPEPAQPVAPAPASMPVETKPDPLIFKRTTVIDGQIDPGEWDIFSSAEIGVDKVTTHANWDNRNLYLAISGTKLVRLTAVIDAAGDGWFHGADNYRIEFFSTQSGSVSADVARYDSRGAKAEPFSVADPPSFLARAGTDGRTMEIAIPQESLTGLSLLKSGKKLGLRLVARVDDSISIPQSALGEVVKTTLVAAKSASLDPVEIEMNLRDHKIAFGEELVSKLTIRNKSKERVQAETFVIGGEGRAAKFLSSEMVRIEELKAGAKIRRTFRSRIPKDMPPGSWGVGAEVRSATGRLGGTLISFEVVPPYEVSIETGDQKYIPGVYEWHSIRVVMRNNTRDQVTGEVRFLPPEGWQVYKNDAEKLFDIPNEDGVYAVLFRTRLTDKAKPGPAQLKAEVKIGKERLIAAKTVEVTGAG